MAQAKKETRRWSNWQKLRKLICAAIAGYLAMLAGLYFFQRDFIYLPSLAEQKAAAHPVPADSRLQPFEVTTTDGVELKGLWSPAEIHAKTIVFFHGNADNLRTMAYAFTIFMNAHYGVLLVEYRGFNSQRGNPSEQGLYADARAFLDGLKAKGVREQDIILYGHSLGSGVAVQMAREYKTAAIALAAPYLSVAKMAQYRFPVFPAESLTQDRFDNLAKIAQIKAPLLIGHGDQDTVIPLAQGQGLFAAAQEPKTFLLLKGKGHNDMLESFNVELIKWLLQSQ